MGSDFWFVCVVLPRLSNTRSAYRPQWGFNWPLEGLIWLPPIGIVVVLGVHLWHDTHRLDPYKPLPGEALNIEVIAADWKWIFIYPEQGIATVNWLVVPAGQAVHLQLTSATVVGAAGDAHLRRGLWTGADVNYDRLRPGLASAPVG